MNRGSLPSRHVLQTGGWEKVTYYGEFVFLELLLNYRKSHKTFQNTSKTLINEETVDNPLTPKLNPSA
jgi:hypothetical protein